ncbi:hypothetical protein Bbelb_321570 [Branchiostoma belcheri]|nr:hypothetical protein Bbelb_321570 [Branchiostoma belcheri]
MEMCAGGPYNSLRVVWGTYQVNTGGDAMWNKNLGDKWKARYNRPPGRSVTLIEFGTLRANQTPAVKNLPGESSPGGRGRASAAPKKTRPNHGRLDTRIILDYSSNTRQLSYSLVFGTVTLTPVTPGYTRRLPDYGLDMPGKGGDSTGWMELHNRQLSHSMRPSCH